MRFSAAALAVLAAACAGTLAHAQGAQGRVTFDRRELGVETPDGTVRMTVEIARDDDQRRQGLMYRTRLDDGAGMLFVFDRDEILSFWMKNTEIPLSIAFLAADGRVLEIHDMLPRSLAQVRSSRSARYALEVPQGWFARAGIAPGAVVRVDALAPAGL